jgi:hypothetical protein
LKKLSAILFCVLLAWMQIAPLSASAQLPSCCQTETAGMNSGTDSCCCGDADCCAAQSSQDSKPAPAVPTQSRVQSPVLHLSPVMAVWELPNIASPSFSSTEKSSVTDASAPLYAQNCALLL